MEFKEGDKVLVWDDEQTEKQERIFLFKCKHGLYRAEAIHFSSRAVAWDNCEQIPTKKKYIFELTDEQYNFITTKYKVCHTPNISTNECH